MTKPRLLLVDDDIEELKSVLEKLWRRMAIAQKIKSHEKV